MKYLTSILILLVSGAAFSEVRIGVIAPLSGVAAEAGKEMSDAASLAAGDLNKMGADVKVSVEDGCLPVSVRTALLNLVSLHNVQGIAGNYCVIGLLNNVSLINQKQLPFIHTSVLPDGLFAKNTFVNSITGRISVDAKLDARYVFGEKKMKSAAIIYIESPWSDGYVKSFTEEAKQLGGKVLSATAVPIEMTDFRSILPAALSGNPESIYVVHFSSPGGVLVRQIRQGGFKGLLFGPHEIESDAFRESAGKAAEGFTFFSPVALNESDKEKVFGEHFKSVFGRAPQNVARWTYDGIVIMAKALQECSGNNICAQQSIRKLKGFTGASGSLSFDDEGAAVRAYTRKEYRQVSESANLDSIASR